MRAKSKNPRAILAASNATANQTRVLVAKSLPMIFFSSTTMTMLSMALPKRNGMKKEKPMAAKRLK